MSELTSVRKASALARLENLHCMLTLDEAVEILTGAKRSLGHRIREATRKVWREASYAVATPLRKSIEAIDGELMFEEGELELFLRRCRRTGFIPELGMQLTYYEVPAEGIRIISADLRAALMGEPPLEFPDCIAELRRGIGSFENDSAA